MQRYTTSDIAFIKAHAHKGRQWLANALNKPLNSVTAAMKNRGINSGKDCKFKKGHNPWNAGRTDMRVSPQSEFKKGNMPANTLHDGAITTRKDRDSKTAQLRRYKYIRVALGKWELYQRYVWEQHFGPIPERHIVRFKDGNTLNCDIGNLELITMSENARGNRNRAKISKTIKMMMEEGEWSSGTKELSDNYVAGLLASGDMEFRAALIRDNYGLVELKRLQLQLNRQIKL